MFSRIAKQTCIMALGALIFVVPAQGMQRQNWVGSNMSALAEVARIKPGFKFQPTNQLFLELKRDMQQTPEPVVSQSIDICSQILAEHYEKHKHQEENAVSYLVGEKIVSPQVFTTTNSYTITNHDLKQVYVTTQSRPVGKITTFEINNKTRGKSVAIPKRSAGIFITLLTKIKNNAECAISPGERYRAVSALNENGKTFEIYAGLKEEETDCIIEYPENMQFEIKINK